MSASQAFGVRGIPTLAIFKGGKEVERQSGALPYERFKPWVGPHT
jgi:thioredoxin-like negative regulator of GroEL